MEYLRSVKRRDPRTNRSQRSSKLLQGGLLGALCSRKSVFTGKLGELRCKFFLRRTPNAGNCSINIVKTKVNSFSGERLKIEIFPSHGRTGYSYAKAVLSNRVMVYILQNNSFHCTMYILVV